MILAGISILNPNYKNILKVDRMKEQIAMIYIKITYNNDYEWFYIYSDGFEFTSDQPINK